MTLIRAYQSEDLETLEQMHRQSGLAYQFPEIVTAKGEENPLFVRKLVVERGGKPVMAMLARMTCEGFLLQDISADPRTRWDRFKVLQAQMCNELFEAGLEDAHVFLPPVIAKGFGRRLVSLGWIREPYTPYCKFLEKPREVA